MRTLAVIPDEELYRELAGALNEFPEIELVRHVRFHPDREDFLHMVRARRPDFVFISVDDYPRFQALAAAIDDVVPGVPVIGVARHPDLGELMPKLMHLGVRDLLTSPVTPAKLGVAITSVAQRLAKHPAPLVRLADIYTFFPAKPGVGSSTIAVGTSCVLAHELRVRTLLLDCDLTAGITRFLLKLGASSSIVNALDHADTLDEDLWAQMVGHWDRLEILHAGEHDPPAALKPSSLETVLGFARAQYDTICADLASSLDSFTVQIMHEARRIFMVTTPEVVALHMAADRLEHLKELGLSDRVSLLLNRRNPPSRGLSDDEAGNLVGLPVTQWFANDYPGVQSAILDGGPIPPRSTVGQGIMALARSIAPNQLQREEPTRHRKFLEFFSIPSSREHETVWRG